MRTLDEIKQEQYQKMQPYHEVNGMYVKLRHNTTGVTDVIIDSGTPLVHNNTACIDIQTSFEIIYDNRRSEPSLYACFFTFNAEGSSNTDNRRQLNRKSSDDESRLIDYCRSLVVDGELAQELKEMHDVVTTTTDGSYVIQTRYVPLEESMLSVVEAVANTMCQR